MIPDAIRREHMIAAMARIDRDGIPPGRESRTHDVLHEGRRYPPKFLVSIACEIGTGRPLPSVAFTGGPETNGFLRRRGFVIVAKQTGRPVGVYPRGTSRRRPSPAVAPSEQVEVDLANLATRLTHTAPLHTWADLHDRPDLPPATAGVYAWFFKMIPSGVPCDGCIERDGRTLLYVGISPASATSRETLRSRIRYHYRGNAEGSTLRRTLGCLLRTELGTVLRHVGSGKRRTFGPQEAALSRWMAENATVAWVEVARPRLSEQYLLNSVSLPLNIEGNNRHPFRSDLRVHRAQARLEAKGLPVLPNQRQR
jgi:hypothetical protein